MNSIREFLDPLQARWRGLPQRDRYALASLGAFFAVVLFYLLVWSPLHVGLTRLREQLPATQAQLARMREQAMFVENLRRTAPAAANAQNVNPLAAVEQAADRNGLRDKLKQIEATGTRGVRIQIDGAAFTAVTAWLVDLRKSGLRAESAVFEKGATPGAVNARITLTGAGL